MKYTQIPSTAFKNIQMNAGILTDTFNAETGVIGTLIGATSGGINFTATPEYADYADDIDNAPKNMLEMKKLTSWEAKMSGTFVSVTASLAERLVGAGAIDTEDETHIIPSNDVDKKMFKDIWWVGDYSDVNTGDNAGFCAIHLMNALSTGGFQIQSTDNGKGTFSFEFTGHYSMEEQDTVPFEIYIVEGSEA